MYDPKTVIGCTEMIRSTISALGALLTALEAAEVKEQPVEKPVTLEALRSVLSGKITEGYGTEIRTLIQNAGASRLSDVTPDKYADLLKAAAAIGKEDEHAT